VIPEHIAAGLARKVDEFHLPSSLLGPPTTPPRLTATWRDRVAQLEGAGFTSVAFGTYGYRADQLDTAVISTLLRGSRMYIRKVSALLLSPRPSPTIPLKVAGTA
jgi:hypothetical protein